MVKKIKSSGIDLIVYDFDGVMTDNKVLILEDGHEGVFCNRADGLAIQKIKELGIPQVILSTENNRVVRNRAKKLNLHLFQGIKDKKSALVMYCKRKNYRLKRIVYIGNDINDLQAMKIIGYPIAPKDADTKVKDVAKVIIDKNGGDGVIREFFNQILFTRKEL